MRSALVAIGLMAIPLSGCVGTPAAYEPTAVRADEVRKGYLVRPELEALAAAVPSPPATASPEYALDIALSASLTRFEDTDRWLLATSHAELRSPYALQHFDCVLGVRFDPDSGRTPANARLFQRLFEDAEAASSIVKLKAHRARPVGDDPQRRVCQTVSPAGRASASYPSGSATVAAAYGAAIARLDPERAEAALDMGHAIAVSRAICGMHYPSDVRVGEALGKAVFERAMQSPEFARDLAAARAELVQLKNSGQTNPACAAERRALEQSQDLRL